MDIARARARTQARARARTQAQARARTQARGRAQARGARAGAGPGRRHLRLELRTGHLDLKASTRRAMRGLGDRRPSRTSPGAEGSDTNLHRVRTRHRKLRLLTSIMQEPTIESLG